MVAAARSKVFVELLLEKGAVVDEVDLDGNSALMKAAGASQTDIVDLLLRHKADPNRPNKNEETPPPLMFAIQANDDVMLKSLLEAGANPNLSGRYELLKKDQVGVVLFSGVVPPLAAAVMQDSPEIVNLLIQHKADLNARFNRGGGYVKVRTALIEAVLKRNLKTCQLILDAGANVQEADEDGLTPLHHAVQGGTQNRETIALLLEHKADPNAISHSGETPMDLAKRSALGGKFRIDYQLKAAPTPPMPGPPPSMPLRAATSIPASLPGENRNKQRSPEENEIVDLLRQAGANEHHRRLQAIWFSRPGTRINDQWFLKGTNAHNHFSLGDVILKCFKYPDNRYRYFADMSLIKIRRLDPATGQEKVIPIDFDAILAKGDPESDIKLEWGDIVEVSEADHLVNESWSGPKKEWKAGLNRILMGYMQVLVRGQTNHFILKPIKDIETDPVKINVLPDGKLELYGLPRNAISPSLDVPPHVLKRISTPVQGIRIVDQELLCWLYSVLRQAGVIRASSDLSRVKATRVDPSTGQHTIMIYDSREQDLVNDL